MSNRLLIPFIAVICLMAMGVFFLLNPSYEKSLRAKYYFETGEYQEALVLSRDAFAEDRYNRMAATVMAQSITSLKYVKYNLMAQDYMKQIDEIATHEYISDADKAKIRLICDIMIAEYIKLAPSVITDKTLVSTTNEYYKKFEQLLEKVTAKK